MELTRINAIDPGAEGATAYGIQYASSPNSDGITPTTVYFIHDDVRSRFRIVASPPK